MKPGEFFLAQGEIELNAGKKTCIITVTNTGDRPIQVGSHFHFFESNKALRFNRADAFGMRLNIKAGTAIRFEPGQTCEVTLVQFGGTGVISGFNRLVEGSIHDPAVKERALKKVQDFCGND